MSDQVWLDELIDTDTHAALEPCTSDAANRDAGLRRLMAGTTLLRNAVSRAVTGTLRIDPLQTLADGWAAADDIRAFGEASRPGGPVVLKLGGHSLERDLRPVINVDTGAGHRFRLDLAFVLSGIFEGAEITLHRGRLISVGAGTCSLALGARVAGDEIMPAKTLKSLHLPAEYRFVQPPALY